MPTWTKVVLVMAAWSVIRRPSSCAIDQTQQVQIYLTGGIGVGVEDAEQRPVSERNDIRIAARTAGTIDDIGVAVVELPGESPGGAAVGADAAAHARPGRIFVSVDSQDGARVEAVQFEVGAFEPGREKRAPGRAVVAGVRRGAVEGGELADHRQKATVAQTDEVEVRVVTVRRGGEDRRR